MKRWVLVLLSFCCTSSDETDSGSRARCAEGGVLTTCADTPSTPDDACWRLVDCGAIAISSSENSFDWGQCVDRIETSIGVAQSLIIHCIAASSCDSLRVSGSPNNPNRNLMTCFQLGGR